MADFLANRVHVDTLSAGAGDLSLGAAISAAYQSFAGASVPNGATFPYTAYTATQFECGRAAYISAGAVLDRTASAVIAGSAGAGALVNFGANPRVFIGPLANTFLPLEGGTVTGAILLPAANPTGATEATHKGYVDGQISSLNTAISGKQPLDATLTALAGLDTTVGLVEQTGTDTFTKRALGVAAATSVLTRADGDGRYTATGTAQPLDATLTALAGLNATAGLVEQTAADTFTKRAIGVASATDILTRADGDGRFSLLGHTHVAANVTDFSEAVDDRVAALIQNGTGISWSYNDVANTLTPTVSLASFSTTNLAEGTNLYYTSARVAAETSVTNKVLKAGDTMTGVLTNTNATVSTNTTTGAVVVTGGIGVGGAVNVGGSVTVAGAIYDLDNSGVQIQGTNTSDNAIAQGYGEYWSNFLLGTTARSATVTITIASPAVVTWTGHPLFANGKTCTAIKFTTTGALPTGITASTTYYAVWVDANTFKIATSVANAIAGTFINTSGTQSGVHTGDIRTDQSTGVSRDIAAMQLTAGDWDVWAFIYYIGSGTTVIANVYAALSTTSGTGATFEEGRYAGEQYPASYTPGASIFACMVMPQSRFSFSAATTVFLTLTPQFSASTMIAYGGICARRAR